MTIRRFFHLTFAITANLACTHASLDVQSVSAHTAVSVEKPCGPGAAPEECLRSKRPAVEIRIVDASSVQWARLSSDGGFMVASVQTHLSDGSDVSFVSAFDLRTRRELWRIRLADADRPAASDCFLLPSGVALAFRGSGDAEPGVVVLDRQTGAKKWHRSSSDAPWGLQVLGADEENDFLLTTEGHSVRVVDGASGKVLATMPVFPGDETDIPRIHWTPNAAYVVASGIARVARRERRFSWQQRFATYGYNPSDPGHTELTDEGAAALAVSGIISAFTLPKLGVGALVWQTRRYGATDADYRIARTTAPIAVGGRLCVGSLGIISCFDEKTGAFVWSRRFRLAQFRSVTEGPDSLCAVAGGIFLHRRGMSLSIERSRSGPLVCLNPRDGGELAGLEMPFTHGIALTQAALGEYDSQTAWKEAVQAATAAPNREDEGPSPSAAIGVQSGLLVADDHQVVLFELPSGRMASTTDLGDIGSVQQLASTADTVVASTDGGFAGFDRRTGALLWKRPLAITGVQAIEFSNHDSQGLVRISEIAGREIDYANGAVLDKGMYWLLPDAKILVAGGAHGALTGISLDDGSVRWQLDSVGHASIDGTAPNRFLVLIGGNSIGVYKLTASN
jgi:outer membrane protein assembly factor BamB